MPLVVELECPTMRLAQLKGGEVVLHVEHLVVGEGMKVRINGEPVDFHIGDDLRAKTSRKDLMVRALDMVDAIRVSQGENGQGRYVWEDVDPPVELKRISLETFRIPGFEANILEGVRLDGERPDEAEETYAEKMRETRTIPVTDPFFVRYPLHFE